MTRGVALALGASQCNKKRLLVPAGLATTSLCDIAGHKEAGMQMPLVVK